MLYEVTFRTPDIFPLVSVLWLSTRVANLAVPSSSNTPTTRKRAKQLNKLMTTDLPTTSNIWIRPSVYAGRSPRSCSTILGRISSPRSRWLKAQPMRERFVTLMFVFLCLYSFVPSFWTISRHTLILLLVKNVLRFSRLKRRSTQSVDCRLTTTFTFGITGTPSGSTPPSLPDCIPLGTMIASMWSAT